MEYSTTQVHRPGDGPAADAEAWWHERVRSYRQSVRLFHQVVRLRDARIAVHARIVPATPRPVEAPPRAPTSGDRWAPLSPRERDVAALVARGLTNRQIAKVLVLTEGTVANHVRRALQRAGFESRARLAAWVAEDPSRRSYVPRNPLNGLCTSARTGRGAER